jgi:hypothetical protein
MRPMREEDVCKAASGWEGARRLTRLSGIVMGGGFLDRRPPQYPASDHHGRWRGKMLLCKHPLPASHRHACGRDRRRFSCFRSLIPSRSKPYNARQYVFSAVCHACARPYLGNHAFSSHRPQMPRYLSYLVPVRCHVPVGDTRLTRETESPDRPRADLESLNRTS